MQPSNSSKFYEKNPKEKAGKNLLILSDLFHGIFV
jgi:hypothetical protein